MLAKSNKTPSKLGHLLSRSEIALAGAELHHVSLNLLRNSPENLRTAIAGVKGGVIGEVEIPGALAGYNQAWESLVNARSEKNLVERQTYKFCATSVDTFKGIFGRTAGLTWGAIGMNSGTLEIPRDCSRLIEDIRLYLEREPSAEYPGRGITAEAAAAMAARLHQSRAKWVAAKGTLENAIAAKDASVKALRRQFSSLVPELKLLLAPDDLRWHDFGLARPIDLRLPEPVSEIVLTSPHPGEVRGSWEKPVRAAKYRVLYKRPADAEFVQHGVVLAPEVLLKEMPSGAEVLVRVTSINRSGETAVYAEANIVVA